MIAQSNNTTARPSSDRSNFVAQVLCVVALVLVLMASYPGPLSLHHILALGLNHAR